MSTRISIWICLLLINVICLVGTFSWINGSTWLSCGIERLWRDVTMSTVSWRVNNPQVLTMAMATTWFPAVMQCTTSVRRETPETRSLVTWEILWSLNVHLRQTRFRIFTAVSHVSICRSNVNHFIILTYQWPNFWTVKRYLPSNPEWFFFLPLLLANLRLSVCGNAREKIVFCWTEGGGAGGGYLCTALHANYLLFCWQLRMNDWHIIFRNQNHTLMHQQNDQLLVDNVSKKF